MNPYLWERERVWYTRPQLPRAQQTTPPVARMRAGAAFAKTAPKIAAVFVAYVFGWCAFNSVSLVAWLIHGATGAVLTELQAFALSKPEYKLAPWLTRRAHLQADLEAHKVLPSDTAHH